VYQFVQHMHIYILMVSEEEKNWFDATYSLSSHLPETLAICLFVLN